MERFEIKFEHTEKSTYTAFVDADNKEAAFAKFDDDPFGYVKDDEPEDVQGIDIDILSTKNIESVLQKVDPLVMCASGKDGECNHKLCPQIRDNEPEASGRHCPLDDISNWEC